jgi:cytochrome c biogenesis protein CcmG, thiol:disulfide interchange protein DsbE
MHAVVRRGVLVGLTWVALAASGSALAVGAEVGRSAPDFFLPSIHQNDDPIALSAFRGRVVYLDFWSAWCVPCRRVMPELESVRRAHPREDFEVIAVNVDTVIADARRFLDETSVTYPVAVDPAGAIARLYGVAALPASFLIDREGRVRHVAHPSEARDVRELRRLLKELIQGGDI